MYYQSSFNCTHVLECSSSISTAYHRLVMTCSLITTSRSDIEPRLDVINISDASTLMRNVMEEYKVEEFYLEHAVSLLSPPGNHADARTAPYKLLLQQHKSEPQSPSFQVSNGMLDWLSPHY